MTRATPLRRLGYARFLRNVLIAAGNSGEAGMVDSMRTHLDHSDPAVRVSAIWALAQLLDKAGFSALRDQAIGCESDPDVLDEWRTGAA